MNDELREFKVDVFNDSGLPGKVYTVMATSEIDARSIAFILDGGVAKGLDDFDSCHIELVKLGPRRSNETTSCVVASDIDDDIWT